MNIKTDLFTIETLSKLENPGLLILSMNKVGKSNVMTVGWALIGTFWRTPVFMIAVRPTRYTHRFIEESKEFTANVPTDDMGKIVETCGTVSGRKTDKIKECKLALKKAKKSKPRQSNSAKSPTNAKSSTNSKSTPNRSPRHQTRALPKPRLPHSLLRKNLSRLLTNTQAWPADLRAHDTQGNCAMILTAQKRSSLRGLLKAEENTRHTLE